MTVTLSLLDRSLSGPTKNSAFHAIGSVSREIEWNPPRKEARKEGGNINEKSPPQKTFLMPPFLMVSYVHACLLVRLNWGKEEGEKKRKKGRKLLYK